MKKIWENSLEEGRPKRRNNGLKWSNYRAKFNSVVMDIITYL